MMLISVDQARALEYLVSCIDQVQTFSETLQLVIVELVHKVEASVRKDLLIVFVNTLQPQDYSALGFLYVDLAA